MRSNISIRRGECHIRYNQSLVDKKTYFKLHPVRIMHQISQDSKNEAKL